MMFQVSQLTFYQSLLFYQRKAIKSSCVLTSLCFVGNEPQWLCLLMLSIHLLHFDETWPPCARCASGGGGEGVCPPCPSTLLLHFFNQRQKKAVFWPVCQQRPAATPLQQRPTLPPPLRCSRQIKNKNPCKSGGEATITHTHSLMSAALTRLLSSLFPCLLFISSANFFCCCSEVTSRNRQSD